MNQSLTALHTKLNWQINELSLHLHATEKESVTVRHQIEELEQQINQTCISPLIINPELEINKLNFLTQQQEKKDELTMILKNHQAVETKLKDKLQRVNTELKMLERYIERERLDHQRQQKKIQENALDEWAIQKRKPYENQ